MHGRGKKRDCSFYPLIGIYAGISQRLPPPEQGSSFIMFFLLVYHISDWPCRKVLLYSYPIFFPRLIPFHSLRPHQKIPCTFDKPFLSYLPFESIQLISLQSRMQDRKAPSLQLLPEGSQPFYGEEAELRRLHSLPDDSLKESASVQPISLPRKVVIPSSRGTPSSCWKWLARIILLLLSFLIMEGYLGMQLRASRMRRFGENMEKLHREKLVLRKEGSRSGFGKGKGKGAKRKIQGDSHLLNYYEAAGGIGQGEREVSIMSKSGERTIKSDSGNAINLPTLTSVQDGQVLSQTTPPSFPQTSFGFYTQGPKATAPSDPILSPQTDHLKEQVSLLSPEKSTDSKYDRPTLLHHRNNKMQSFRIPSLVQQVKKQDKHPQKQAQPQVTSNPSSSTAIIETTPYEISPEAIISPTILPFLSPTPSSISTPKIHFDSFASIRPSQLATGTQLRALLNSPPLPSQQVGSIVSAQRQYYQSRYRISAYPQLPFCLVVPTYNNVDQERYLRNLNSILQQQYSNFHLVVLDDHSEDGTGGMIKNLLERQNILPSQRYRVILNQKRVFALRNIRTAALDYCSPEEIFMIVDGDDQLIGRQVLRLYNAIFQERGVYFLYSNFMTAAGGVGYSRPFPEDTIRRNAYRSYPFVTSHLRAFYTILLRNISEQDLKDDNGEYFKAANDVAICLPILQQAHERVGYLPEVTYYYVGGTGRNNHELRLEEQRGNERRVRGKSSYRRVEGLGVGKKNNGK